MDRMPLPGDVPDTLFDFLTDSDQKTCQTIESWPGYYNVLRCGDVAFRTLVGALCRAQTIDPIARLLALRAHGCFLAAARSALPGLIPETYMLLRGAIECGLACALLRWEPQSRDIWVKRHAGPEQRRLSSKAFAASRILKDMTDRSSHLGTIEQLYQVTIDWGAHPNIRSVVGQMQSKVDHEDEGASINLHYLSTGSRSHLFCITVAAEVALVVVELLGDVFPEEARGAALSEKVKLGWEATSPLVEEHRRRIPDP